MCQCCLTAEKLPKVCAAKRRLGLAALQVSRTERVVVCAPKLCTLLFMAGVATDRRAGQSSSGEALAMEYKVFPNNNSFAFPK
jgi:hypothetical protein